MSIRFHRELLPHYEAYVALEILLNGARHKEWKAPLLAAGLEAETARLYDGRLALLDQVREKAWPVGEVAALLTSGDETIQSLCGAELLAGDAIPHRLGELARLLELRQEAQRQRMVSERLAEALDLGEPIPQDTPSSWPCWKDWAGKRQKYHLLWLYHHTLEAAQALQGLCPPQPGYWRGPHRLCPRARQAMDALQARRTSTPIWRRRSG